jgi:hypothetical protein
LILTKALALGYMIVSLRQLMEPAGRAAWSEDFALSTLYYADSITSVQDDQIPLIELHGLVIMLLII